MTTNHPLNLMAEHLAARSKDIADRDEVIEELLEALQNFVNHGSCFDEQDMQQARAAIARATHANQ